MKIKVIGLIITIILVVLLFIGKGLFSRKIVTEIPLIQSTASARILIPITINDTSYFFIWDTGADKSMILEKRINNIPIQVSDTIISQTVLHARERITFESRIGILKNARIGEILLPDQEIEVSNFKKLADSHRPAIVGLIGQDIISKYCWMIDFQNKIIKVSNHPFPEEYSERHTFVLPFFYPNKISKVPFVNLALNDSIEDQFLFDTGWSSGITLKSTTNNKSFTLKPTIIINKNRDRFNVHSDKIVELEDTSRSALKEHKKIMTLDSVTINNHNFKNLKISEEYLLKELNICSFHFVELFTRMYYNPQDKKITLVYPNTHPQS